MAKKQALGRGLSALLKDPSEVKKTVGSITEIELDSIQVNPNQPRTKFNKEALEDLAASITELGVIQPVTVRKLEDDTYQLISGERRFRASQLAGLIKIPVYIRLADDTEMLEMAIVENLQRQDLDSIEIALSFKKLINECNLTQDEMSKRVGKNRSTITNYLRLLKLDPIIQMGIRDNMISMAHGRAIINISDEKLQLDIFEKIVKDSLSVRQTEEIVRNAKTNKKNIIPKSKDKIQLTDYHKNLQESMTNLLGSKVKVKLTKTNQGKLEIPFKSKEELEKIKKLLQ